MPTNFAQFWFPDFIGIAYGVENENIMLSPYFDDLDKAKYVSSKIENWKPNFIRVRFIEYNTDDYAFIAYENPKGSYEKINFGLYRSSMNQKANYSIFKDKIQRNNCKLEILFSEDVNNPSKFKPVGNSLSINDCRILNEAELESSDYPIEKWAHETCRGG